MLKPFSLVVLIAAPALGLTTRVLLTEGEEVLALQPVEILPHDLSVRALAADAKGKRLFTVDSIGVVRGWDREELDKGEPLWVTAKHQFGNEAAVGNVFDLSIGDEVGARSGPTPVPSFDSVDLEKGSLRQSMGSSLGGQDMNDLNATKAVLVDVKDRWVWVGAERGVARLMVSGVSGWSQRGVPNGGVTCLGLGPKAKEVAIGGEDGTVRFVGNTSCDVDEKSVFEGHEDAITAVVWHPQGKLVASTSGRDKVIFHRRRGGKIDTTLELPKVRFTELAFHPKGKWMAAGTAKGKVVVWDLKKEAVVAEAELPKAMGEVHSLAVLDKGKTLIAAGHKSIVQLDMTVLGK